MLDEYTHFVDKILQEKVDLSQYYENVAQNNKELKAQLSKYEVKFLKNNLIMILEWTL